MGEQEKGRVSSGLFKAAFQGKASEIRLGAFQIQGMRESQEDSFGYDSFGKKPEFIAVVADGMGGRENSGQVSAYAVEELLSGVRGMNGKRAVSEELSRITAQMNEKALAKKWTGGSTLAAVYCNSDGIFWHCIGDSRAYLFRKGLLVQLNEDSSYRNTLLEQVIGENMDYEDVEKDRQREALTQYIGKGTGVRADGNLRPLAAEPGDKILLCSDGVYRTVSQETLKESLGKSAADAAEDICGRILAEERADQDNATALVLEFI